MSVLPDWPRAHGRPLFAAQIRSVPSDFLVTEQSAIVHSGEGEHDFLWVEKTGNNSQWVAEQLAKFAGVPVRDVGLAGLKDRHAVTRQWFSVRRDGESDWAAFVADGVEILEQRRHRRKLRRGAHTGNRFKIALRAAGIAQHREQIAARLAQIAAAGVPNYFGEQRFGRGGSNIDLARQVFAGRRLSRAKRSIALSAARSVVFNTILSERVKQESWAMLLPGELANLDGSGSVFSVVEVTAELAKRCAEQDVHPTASLWGDGSPRSEHDVAELELAVIKELEDFTGGLVAARMESASRALRLRVADLHWELTSDALWLQFELPKGGYATSVLREVAQY